MKYAIVIMDGAADEPLEELGGLTVLEKANKPNIDWISQNGKQGLVSNVPEGYSPGSDVALMSLLGYNPQKYYTGRAPLEAASIGIQTSDEDWIFRCNLVTIADGNMIDYSAGHINTAQAKKLVLDLNKQLGNEIIQFYPGVGYRHIMVHKGGNFDTECTPPHDIIDQPAEKYLPKGKNGKILRNIMEQASKILEKHEVNQVRSDLDENPATNIWLWGQGKRPKLDKFKTRFEISGSVISAVDLMRGLGKLMDLSLIDVDGATGYLDTNYAGKGQAAISALDNEDIVIVHIEAPDEAGHGALIDEKIKAIEQIDQHIVGPLLDFLKSQDQWRILVLPDHPTPIRLRTHTSDPVPFTLAGTDVPQGLGLRYSEKNAEKSGFRIDRGYEMMEYFKDLKEKDRIYGTRSNEIWWF